MTRSNLCRLEQNGENVKLETLDRYAAAIGCELFLDIRELQTSQLSRGNLAGQV